MSNPQQAFDKKLDRFPCNPLESQLDLTLVGPNLSCFVLLLSFKKAEKCKIFLKNTTTDHNRITSRPSKLVLLLLVIY